MLTDAVLLDISQAQRQIDQLERELDRLSTPVRVPIDIEGDRAVDELRRDFQGADAGVAELNSELAETERELRRIDRAADDSTDAILRVGTRGASAFTSLKLSVLGAAAGFAAIAGARAFIGFAGDAISAASDLEESISKTNVVFGDFSDEIQEFARTGPTALGLANREALAFTSTFGNLFVALGLSQQEAAELSPAIVQLGADLASFNNIDVSEALEKLRSGLVGEAEPLRSLGVNINEAVTSAKAMELGLVGMNGELSEAAKVQARYALILEQTVTAQGDFARTADGIANRQRTLRAQFEDLRATIGEALVPVFERLLDVAPKLLEGLEDLVPVIQSLSTSLAGIDPSGIGDVAQTLAEVPTVFGTLASTGDAVFNILTGIAELNFSQVADGINQIQEAADNIDVREVMNGLINDLQRGVDPAIGLRDALAALGDADIDTDQFEEFARSLIAIAGVKPEGVRALRDNVRLLGPALGFSADELAVLNRLLAEMTAQLVFSPEAFRQFGGAAEAAINQIGEAEAEFGALPQIIQGGLDAALRRVEFAGSVDAFAASFADDLNSSFSTALQEDDGDIETNAKQFVDRFVADLEAEAELQANIDKIREAGGTLLAAFLEGEAEAGVDVAPLAANFLKNPEQIAEFEAAGRAAGIAEAQEELAAFLETIEAADFSGVAVPSIEIPLVLGPLPTFPQFTGLIPGQGGGGNITYETNVYNPTPESTETSAANAAAIINSGVNAAGSGPS